LAKVGAVVVGSVAFNHRYAADDDTPSRFATTLTRSPVARTSPTSFSRCSAVY
jgi:hypothetical protein